MKSLYSIKRFYTNMKWSQPMPNPNTISLSTFANSTTAQTHLPVLTATDIGHNIISINMIIETPIKIAQTNFSAWPLSISDAAPRIWSVWLCRWLLPLSYPDLVIWHWSHFQSSLLLMALVRPLDTQCNHSFALSSLGLFYCYRQNIMRCLLCSPHHLCNVLLWSYNAS